jgi:hypothetical protein
VRKVAALLSIGLLVHSIDSASAATKIVPGSQCKTYNQKRIYQNKIFTCIKLGKKLYWDNGSRYNLEKQTPTPTVTISPRTSTSTTPSQSPSFSPPVLPSPTQSLAVPLLRDSDVSFYAGKLKVVWNGLDTSQKSLTNLRRINVWLYDLQSEQSLAGGLWRVACFIAPTPGAFCEISMPPKEYAVKISAYYLSGDESGYSTTIRIKANYVSPAPIG